MGRVLLKSILHMAALLDDTTSLLDPAADSVMRYILHLLIKCRAVTKYRSYEISSVQRGIVGCRIARIAEARANHPARLPDLVYDKGFRKFWIFQPGMVPSYGSIRS